MRVGERLGFRINSNSGARAMEWQTSRRRAPAQAVSAHTWPDSHYQSDLHKLFLQNWKAKLVFKLVAGEFHNIFVLHDRQELGGEKISEIQTISQLIIIKRIFLALFPIMHKEEIS